MAESSKGSSPKNIDDEQSPKSGTKPKRKSKSPRERITSLFSIKTSSSPKSYEVGGKKLHGDSPSAYSARKDSHFSSPKKSPNFTEQNLEKMEISPKPEKMETSPKSMGTSPKSMEISPKAFYENPFYREPNILNPDKDKKVKASVEIEKFAYVDPGGLENVEAYISEGYSIVFNTLKSSKSKKSKLNESLSPPQKETEKSRRKSPESKFETLVSRAMPKHEYKLAKSPERTYVKETSKYEPLPIETGAKPKSRKSSHEEMDCELDYHGLDYAEKVFPDAAFSSDSLPKNWKVPIEFIKNLISSPGKSPTKLKRSTGLPYSDIESPSKIRYGKKDVYKTGILHLTRQYIHAMDKCRIAKVVLLHNGRLLIYEMHNDVPFEDPLYNYNIYQSSTEKYDKNAFKLSIRDLISPMYMLFYTDNKTERNEWMAALKYVDQLITPNKRFKFSIETEKELRKGQVKVGKEKVKEIGPFYSMGTLGRGTLGKIALCKNLKNKRNYVLKVMRKDLITSHEEEELLIFEYKTLRSYRHEYLQRLKFSIVTKDLVIFGMEYVNGGTLGAYVDAGTFSEELAVYYGAQLAIALMYLHTKGVIVRTLTMHNLHLDYTGNLKIVDFGLCFRKVNKMRFNWHTRVSPSFVAPELVRDMPYTFTADWYSFGVCMLIMVTGKAVNKNDQQVFDGYDRKRIEKMLKAIEYSTEGMSEQMINFLENILHINPAARLGCRNREEKVLEHPIFARLMYNRLNGIEIRPPIIPPVKKNDVTLYPDYRDLADVANREDRSVTTDKKKTNLSQYDISLTPPRSGEVFTIKAQDEITSELEDVSYEDILPYESSMASSDYSKVTFD